MYSWTALLTAQMLVEVPLNIAASALIFFTMYWMVPFPTERAGYTFLIIVIGFPVYFQTFSQAVASMTPDGETAALLFSFLFSFVITFNGVLAPYRELDWWKWMYRVLCRSSCPSAALC
jgi:ATP-binding cassette subfamily G (WHITE) protein 2 (SNQ2)